MDALDIICFHQFAMWLKDLNFAQLHFTKVQLNNGFTQDLHLLC